MIIIIALLCILSALYFFTISRHTKMIQKMQSDFADTVIIKNLTSTNMLASLDASYIALMFKTVLIGVVPWYSSWLLIQASGNLEQFEMYLNNNVAFHIFVSIAGLLAVNTGYRLWKNNNMLRTAFQYCIDEKSTT